MTYSFTQYGRSLVVAAALTVPTLGLAQSPAPLTQAISHLSAQRAKFGLTEADLANPAVTSQYTDSHNGVTHVYLRQRVLGIEVYGAVADVHLDRNGRVTLAHSSFVGQAAQAARTVAPTLTPEQAVSAAARALNMPPPMGLQRQGEGSITAGLRFNDAGISLEPIRVKLMYLPRPDGTLALVWDVELYTKTADHYWSARVDAQNGTLLDKVDLVDHELVSFAQRGQRMADLLGATAALTVGDEQRPNVPNTYNSFALGVESPLHGVQSFVSNPADAVASPFGWHDINGTAGAEYTYTRGNNVHAYEDANADNLPTTPSNSPDGGATLEFNDAYLPTGTPLQNRRAATTNLFVWNNLMHDVMARHGFTEQAGAFRTTNYSGLGLGNDEVQAEAQDGGGFDNANFGTPVDGQRPRMQMYRWQQPGVRPITVTAPSPATYNATDVLGVFGPDLLASGPVSGNLVVVNDGSANGARGCGTLLNAAAISNNIALISRSRKCAYIDQVLNAQAAGARAVIIADSVTSTAFPQIFSSSPLVSQVTIPILGVTKATGDVLRASVAANPVTLRLARNSQRDGDFDNGIIAHEYGHGISNRLTGGPGQAGCVPGSINGLATEGMGEGWSDFFGLWMTTPTRSDGTTARGIGNYATYQPTTGAGIRFQPYSTNFSINNHTYAKVGIAPHTATHAIGEIWAATLWDLNWALIDRYGYNANLYAATGGNNICLQLVLDGCKLQPCVPGFLDGRNAILKADSLNNNAANSALIWQVFARRGMGFSAVQGSSRVINDQVAAFDLPTVLSTKARLSAESLALFPNPAEDRVTVRMAAGSQTPVLVELVNLLGQVVQSTTASAALLQRDGVELNTANVAAGAYVVRLTGSTGTASQKLMVQH
ncbi:M36 family metallopeptidase [Hymenobacter koreensis]|uniref:T9SS-dependent M36 family metallopeptidase n=1 Tax=Hymenobacter koreensis TaxID=1084523 RepID=A0ABP8IZW4_9BACT